MYTYQPNNRVKDRCMLESPKKKAHSCSYEWLCQMGHWTSPALSSLPKLLQITLSTPLGTAFLRVGLRSNGSSFPWDLIRNTNSCLPLQSYWARHCSAGDGEERLAAHVLTNSLRDVDPGASSRTTAALENTPFTLLFCRWGNNTRTDSLGLLLRPHSS